MYIPEFKRTDALQQVPDSIELARELSLELELRETPPSEDDIYAAVHIMNQHLLGVGGNVPSLIKTGEAYLNLPYDAMDVAFLTDEAIERAKVEQAIMRGRIESFHWLGSTAMTGFGVNLYGVELLSPFKQFSASAFVPVEAITTRLAA